MELLDIVTYWAGQRRNVRGQWIHPADESAFGVAKHTFNLDFPVSPFVGDILRAPVVILGANAGYDPGITPKEFPDGSSLTQYVGRMSAPSSSDWSFVSTYYSAVNYGPLVVNGRAALINACAYRSPRISAEPENRRLIKQLPSVALARRWLFEALLPLAKAGQRLIVVKRPGLWRLPSDFRTVNGVTVDPAPISPQITTVPWAAVQEKLRL